MKRPTLGMTHARILAILFKMLRATDRQISDFLLQACHDFRAPLRALRTQAEMLLKNGAALPADDFEQRLGSILDNARRMDLLVTGLSSYSIALQTEEESFRATPLDVLLRNVLVKLEQDLRAAEARVTSDELPRVTGNPDRLIQVFENLLCNALRYRGAEPPRIHVAAEERTDGWLIAVRDNGPGVEAAYLERIFDPFQQLHSTSQSGPGLGLAICRAIVERHGGRMWAESGPGAGAVFLFTLPRAEE